MNRTLIALTICALSGSVVSAQNGPAVILQIDTANRVQYYEDNADPSKFGTDTGVTAPRLPADFAPIITVADIVAINGQPVKGTFFNNSRMLTLRPAPTAGQAIADTNRNSVENHSYEILNLDGTQIGTIIAVGNGSGPAPPGAPLLATQGDNVVVGGTGAFLGARGYVGSVTLATALPTRQASITEDPANRRAHGGGTLRFIMHLIPMTRPEVAIAAGVPVVYHADFSPVTAARPAKAGEVLIIKATGLGATVPGINPGDPFPSDTINVVNFPVQAAVNGQSAPVINAIGWPGLTDTYRVDVRVPEGIPAGTAAVQLTVAWIPGSAASIPIQ